MLMTQDKEKCMVSFHSCSTRRNLLRRLLICTLAITSSASLIHSSHPFCIPVEIHAKAGEDFRQWKQKDPEFNTIPAWPSSLTQGKPHYLGEYGCLVTSIAILMRHYNLINDSSSDFNPLICSQKILDKGLFDRYCNLNTPEIEKAFPNFRFAGRVPYTPEKLAELYNAGYACIAQVNHHGHFIAIDDGSVPGQATIFDPDTNYRYLTEWKDINNIYYFEIPGGTAPDFSPLGTVDELEQTPEALNIRGWAFDRDADSVEGTFYIAGSPVTSFKTEDFRPDVASAFQVSPHAGFHLSADIPEGLNGWTDLKIEIRNKGYRNELFDSIVWSSREYIGDDITLPTVDNVSMQKKGGCATIHATVEDDYKFKQAYIAVWDDERKMAELTNEELFSRPVELNGSSLEYTFIPDTPGKWKIAIIAEDEAGNITRKHAGDSQWNESEKEIPLFRLYNRNSGEHFYTPESKEKEHLVSLGWKDEGTGWISCGYAGEPVFRLYNPNDGDHHYTLSIAERDHLKSLGWKDEGIGWLSPKEGGIPVYRQYNPNARTGTHNYTPDLAEHNALGDLGWNKEGIAWFALPSIDQQDSRSESASDAPFEE